MNQTFIDVNHPATKGFSLRVDGQFLLVSHEKGDEFAVPMSSVSWMKIDGAVIKPKRGRPKKAVSEAV
tara:strand:- start:356 stop:559 length:204 start_codon:yes stop_codon:yes gene_type:complete